MTTAPHDSTPLSINAALVVDEVGHDGSTVMWNPSTGSRTTVGAALTAVARRFTVPMTRSQLQRQIAVEHASPDTAALNEAIDRLRQLEVLVPHRFREQARPQGLFGAPRVELAEALAGDTAHAVAVGVLYDAGATYRPGSRFGPEYLRRVSRGLFQYDMDAAGMHDPLRRRRVLDGVRLCDIGDIAQLAPHRNGAVFDQLEDVVAATAQAGRVPVVMGGDHTISLAVVRGLTRHHDRVGVIHVDAQFDYGDLDPGDWRQHAHHGNFMGWVIGDPAVRQVSQIGVRHLTPVRPQSSPKVHLWPSTTAASDPAAVLDDLPDDLAWHVTIDVDALDPSVMTSTGTPLPGGFGHRELVGLLEHLCRRRHIVGIDLVELIPDVSDIPGLVAADVLLRVVDASLGASAREVDQ